MRILGVQSISKCSPTPAPLAKMAIVFRVVWEHSHGFSSFFSSSESMYFPTLIGQCTQSQAVLLAKSQMDTHCGWIITEFLR